MGELIRRLMFPNLHPQAHRTINLNRVLLISISLKNLRGSRGRSFMEWPMFPQFFAAIKLPSYLLTNANSPYFLGNFGINNDNKNRMCFFSFCYNKKKDIAPLQGTLFPSMKDNFLSIDRNVFFSQFKAGISLLPYSLQDRETMIIL